MGEASRGTMEEHQKLSFVVFELGGDHISRRMKISSE